ncbi:hypothetical protein U1Q18_013865 [Sarracenia purpurea var. burkii]
MQSISRVQFLGPTLEAAISLAFPLSLLGDFDQIRAFPLPLCIPMKGHCMQFLHRYSFSSLITRYFPQAQIPLFIKPKILSQNNLFQEEVAKFLVWFTHVPTQGPPKGFFGLSAFHFSFHGR